MSSSVAKPAFLTRGMFEEHLNTRFWLVDGSRDSYAMDLMEVANGYCTPRQEQFSLRFRGDRNQIFPQRIYPMKHDAMGEFDLFLVPVSRDETGTFYEAVFNRLIQNEDPIQR
ncbi:MAG TPA: hypothetical protein VI386_26145 [Candidatus Sulfotelmatobacter sp.]